MVILNTYRRGSDEKGHRTFLHSYEPERRHPLRHGVRNTTVLLLGPTGSGKSAFIKKATGLDIEVGDGIRPCKSYSLFIINALSLTQSGTQTSTSITTIHNNNSLTLIDTPGLDDTPFRNLEILENIARTLQSQSLSPTWILYFHRITDIRVTGTARLNLEILQAICGKTLYSRVFFVTTRWDTIPHANLPRFEAQVFPELEGLFSSLLPGCRALKLMGEDSWEAVLSSVEKEGEGRWNKKELQFVRELRLHGLRGTAAAEVIVRNARSGSNGSSNSMKKPVRMSKERRLRRILGRLKRVFVCW
ncbi:hypothetical protein OQA88_10743 [Cercophora sp. LCS_1]